MGNAIIESIQGEFLRYKALAENAINQVDEGALSGRASSASNSIATICWHVSGNLRSRFTDFLTSDGEKPWRQRDDEFEARTVTRVELLATWQEGWRALTSALASLTDDDLERTVTIRGQSLRVHEALHRSLAHTSYHVGQIVFVAKATRDTEWTYLSIPPGRSVVYNSTPAMDRPESHAAALEDGPDTGSKR
jgi:uncharacterized damage-inducible protein DinB